MPLQHIRVFVKMAQIYACAKAEQIQLAWTEGKLLKRCELSDRSGDMSSVLAYSNNLSHNLRHHVQLMPACIRHSYR